MVGGKSQTMHNLAALTDEELIALSLRDDTAEGASAAFGALVVRYRKLAISVSYRVCGDAALAEDIAQDTFIRVWDKLSSYRPGGNFRAWMVRIATNMTIDALRRQKPVMDIADLPLVARSPQPESAALSSERETAVREALMRLPLQSRTVLVLREYQALSYREIADAREYQALSYREIADALDIPLGTVKSRLSDARRRLRVELAGYMGLESEAQNGTTRRPSAG
jgi:RNA polymerase sigma-70 factor (ECF subfamily)